MKSKPKTKSRPVLQKSESSKGGDGDSGALFLTAAEQRAQKQKADKKASDDPFSFLVDVKDKDGNRPGEPGYDPRTLYIPSKAWKEFTPFEKQVRSSDLTTDIHLLITYSVLGDQAKPLRYRPLLPKRKVL